VAGRQSAPDRWVIRCTVNGVRHYRHLRKGGNASWYSALALATRFDEYEEAASAVSYLYLYKTIPYATQHDPGSVRIARIRPKSTRETP
jgi:hypothetical protein